MTALQLPADRVVVLDDQTIAASGNAQVWRLSSACRLSRSRSR